ncbi:MAG TPA: hypothetical protein VF080_16750 [Solirubrobacteraceae bacterium]
MSIFDDTAGLKDWQWLFLIEAVPAILGGIFVWRYLDDGRAEAKWLRADEKEWLANRLEGEEAARLERDRHSLGEVLKDRPCSSSASCTSAWSSTSTACRSGSARSSTRSTASAPSARAS